MSPRWNIPSSVNKMSAGTYLGWRGAQPTARGFPQRPPGSNTSSPPGMEPIELGVGPGSALTAPTVTTFGFFGASGEMVVFTAVFRIDSTTPATPTLTHPGVTSFTSIATVTISTGTLRCRVNAFKADGYGVPAGGAVTLTPAEGSGTYIANVGYVVFSPPSAATATDVVVVDTGTASGSTLNIATTAPSDVLNGRAVFSVAVDPAAFSVGGGPVLGGGGGWGSTVHGESELFNGSNYNGLTSALTVSPDDPTETALQVTADRSCSWAWVAVELNFSL